MYSTNIDQHQDGQRQAPNPAPKGGKYIIVLEDVTTVDGRHGLTIHVKTIRKASHETPASHVTGLLDAVINSNIDLIGEVTTDIITRNREGGR